MRRRIHLGRGTALLVFVSGLVALTCLLGARMSNAAGLPTQVAGTTVPASTSTTRTSATTARTSATTAKPTTTKPPVPAPPPSVTAPAVTTTAAPTTTTTTTILGIGGQLPAPPATLPLHTTSSNGHVNPAFAWLSVAGFAIALLMVAYRLYVTRSGGKDRAPVT